MGVGILIYECGVWFDIVVGYDFCGYLFLIKMVVINGLLVVGVNVYDIGLVLLLMVYFV